MDAKLRELIEGSGNIVFFGGAGDLAGCVWGCWGEDGPASGADGSGLSSLWPQ